MIRGILLLLLFNLLTTSKPMAQQQLLDFTQIYYRSNPFTGTMKEFLQHLMNDPEIMDKKIQYRSPNQLFFFTGRYKKYSRLFFVPDSVKVILMEMKVPFADDASREDTIMLYQISAYGNSSPKGQKDVIREWEKIKRQWSKKFFDKEEENVLKDNITTGQYLHFFLPLFTLSPLTVGWTTVSEPDRPVLTITMRIKQNENFVTLPGALNYSQ